MAKHGISKEELTDTFELGSKKLNEQQENVQKKPTLSKNLQYGIAAATVILAGSAFTFSSIEDDGKAVQPPSGDPTRSEENEPSKPLAPVDSTYVAKPPVATGVGCAVPGGNITPNEHIDIATKVNDNMSFGQAYANARAEVGPGGIFSWHGGVYNTYTKEEWHTMPLASRREFLVDVGFQPKINHETIYVPYPVPVPYPIVVDEKVVGNHEIMINGEHAIVIDENRNGMPEAVVIQDEDGDIRALISTNSDQYLDTLARLDVNTGQIVDTIVLDTPLQITVDELVTMSDTSIVGNPTAEMAFQETDFDTDDSEDMDEDDDQETDLVSHTDYDSDADVSDLS